MAEDTLTTVGIGRHGAARLPSVDVDSFNIELKDDDGFLGDRASKGAFRKILDDLRKPLKAVIEADTEFQAKLRALKSSLDARKEESNEYDFLLTNVLETVDSSVQDHRQLLSEQEEVAKHKKSAKP